MGCLHSVRTKDYVYGQDQHVIPMQANLLFVLILPTNVPLLHLKKDLSHLACQERASSLEEAEVSKNLGKLWLQRSKMWQYLLSRLFAS